MGRFSLPSHRRKLAGYYKTEGVVLRSMRLREADRIIHLYTGTHGRVNAVVKGVRRTKSRFGARLEPFLRVRLVLYEGRGDLHTVTQAEAVEWYPRLREHGGAILAAGTACESVLRMFGDGEAQRRRVQPPLPRAAAARRAARGGRPGEPARVPAEAAARRRIPAGAVRLRALRRAAGRRVGPLLLRRRRRDLRRMRRGRRLLAGRARPLVHGDGALRVR